MARWHHASHRRRLTSRSREDDTDAYRSTVGSSALSTDVILSEIRIGRSFKAAGRMERSRRNEPGGEEGGEEIKKETKLRPAEVARPDVAGRQPRHRAERRGGTGSPVGQVAGGPSGCAASGRSAPGLSTAAGRGRRVVCPGWRIVEFCCGLG